MRRTWLSLVALVAVLAAPCVAHAGAVGFDTWYSFDWEGHVATDGALPTTGGHLFGLGAGVVDAPASPWTFDGPARLTVTDLEADIDSFAIYDFGVFVGMTPPAGVSTVGYCGFDPEACIAGGASSGTFVLGDGAHSITIFDIDRTGDTGDGAFLVHAVPEPMSLLLLGSGIVGLGAARRRKSL